MNKYCYVCDEHLDNNAGSIHCVICRNFFYAKCVNVELSGLHTQKTPWKCPSCCDKSITDTSLFIRDVNLDVIFTLLEKVYACCTDMQIKITALADENKQLRAEINNLKSSDCRPMLSYSDVIKGSATTRPQVSSRKSNIIIRPLQPQQSNVKTKKDIMKNIDPVALNLHVSQIKHIKDGGLLVSHDNAESAATFKNVVNEKMSTDYKISEFKQMLPKIRIVGLSEEYQNDEIIRFLRGQNDALPDNGHLKVFKIWSTKNNPNVFQTVVEVDATAHATLMKNGKVYINFDVCTVYDATNVKICYKCCGYNHSQSKCASDKIICPKCSSNHQLNECNSSSLKCVHCTNAKLTNSDHAAWDAVKCPIYVKKLDQLRSNIFNSK